MTYVLTRRSSGDTGRTRVNAEGETGAKHSQTKMCHGLPATPETRHESGSSPGLLKGTSLTNTWISDFQPPEL